MDTKKLQPLFYDFKTNEYVSKKVTESGVCAFQFEQQGKDSRWFINHNRDFELYKVNVFSDDEMIVPDMIKTLDNNNILIEFIEPIEGVANFVYRTDDTISCTPETIIEAAVFVGINSFAINSNDINGVSSII
jgi:hypothetical protein